MVWLFLVILFLLFLSGSVFGAAFLHKPFEKTLPLTFMGVSALLFLFGFCGFLAPGVFCVAVLLILLWIASAFRLFHRRDFFAFRENLLTPSFFFFAVLFCVLVMGNYGKLACSWDEFSHWVDSVKAMTQIDDFVANAASRSMFQSYPPSMTLLQYFVQKLYSFFRLGEFCEWLVYLSYQLFSLSLLFPLLGKIRFRNGLLNLCTFLILAIVPLVFFAEFYATVYIDPFVGLIVGAGLTWLALEDLRESLGIVFFSLLCFMLVLAKDAGKFFVVFLLSGFAVILIKKRSSENQPVSFFRRVLPLLPALVCAGLPLLLWRLILIRYDTPQNFTGDLSIFSYIKMFFLHNDTTFRQQTVDIFKDAFFVMGIQLGNTQIILTFFSWLVVFAVGFLFLGRQASSEPTTGISDRKNRDLRMICGIALLMSVCYAFFLGSVYITQFSEREALELSSYHRYMNMTFLPMWILLLFGALRRIQSLPERKKSSRLAALLCGVVLIASPVRNVEDFLSRDQVRLSVNFRALYEPLTETVHRICGADDHVYLISQENNGLDYFILRYTCRPSLIDGYWSVGVPFYEGDAWTWYIEPENLRSLLLESYDYLAVYHVNDYFLTEYGSLFGDEIQENALYRVDRDSGLLLRADQ